MATGAFGRQQAAGGRRTIRESLNEYGRGIAGGLIFSMPLLYTLEVWQMGETSSSLRLGAGVLGTLLLLIGYNRYAGLHPDASFAEVLIDSVEELGLGLALAALVLWLIGEIGPQMPLETIVGTVLLEGLLVAIGVSVGTAQLGAGQDEQADQGDSEGAGADEQADEEAEDDSLVGTVTLSVCGAVLIAANVAPTEEIMLIAAMAESGRLLGLMALGLALAAVISFFSDFIGTRRDEPPGALEVVRGTALTYGVALAVSAALLWFFGRLDDLALFSAVARVVVLSVPAALGASAGRLLLQS
jgi:putative integral membrane protein (TIGR02587 family)